MTTPTRTIRPQAGPQEQFLTSSADIVIYGGSAGGGKTWALLADPLRHVRTSGFNGLIFRRTYPEIEMTGGLWDESETLYPFAGGKPVKGDHLWRWPGSRIDFSHIQYNADLAKYLSAQICYLAFDQLELFTEKQFWFMQGRNRSTSGVRPYLRATANPPAEGEVHWLTRLLTWWIAEDGYADMSRAGVIRWFVRLPDDSLRWADSQDELLAAYPEVDPVDCRSFTFIPATLFDNKILMAKDPGYLGNLRAQPLIDRLRLLGDPVRGGNWHTSAAAGKVFNRSWFDIVPAAPAGGIVGRGWDFAGTIQEIAGTKTKDPDYICSIRIRKVKEDYFIEDYTKDRMAAGEVYRFVKTLTYQDRSSIRGDRSVLRYLVRWEIEPGSAAQRESLTLQKELEGNNALGLPITGDKVSRWKPLATAAEHGHVKLVEGSWNSMFLSDFHGVPDLPHDDGPDAGSVIYNEIKDMPAEPPKPTQETSLLQEVFG